MIQAKWKQDLEESIQDIYKEQGISETFLQEWLLQFKDDPSIQVFFTKLETLAAKVFDSENPSIDYVPCRNMPLGLNEQTFFQIHRKQQACVRFNIHKIIKEMGGAKNRSSP